MKLEKPLQKFNPGKVIDKNKFLPPLIKIANELLSTPLSIAMNNDFRLFLPVMLKQIILGLLIKIQKTKNCNSNF